MTTQAALGWIGPRAEDIIVTNRTATTVAVGDVVMLDRRRSDGDSTTNVLGTDAAGIANIVVPGAATLDTLNTDTFGVVLKGAADNLRTTVRLRGYCPSVAVNAAVVLATARCHVTASAKTCTVISAAEAVAGTIRKVVFLPITAVGGAGLTDGWFNGVEGFGGILIV
jgi:hypothetical protein